MMFDNFLEALRAAYDHSCECIIDEGQEDDYTPYEDTDECVNDIFTAPAILDCQKQVWADFPIEVQPHLECAQTAATMLDECVKSFDCNLERIYICDQNYYDTVEKSCPKIPFEVNEEFYSRCLGEEYELPFTCADGEEIPATWECDSYADCDDGSDEAGCPFFCYDGTELDTSKVCDGEDDCSTGEDEFGCY